MIEALIGAGTLAVIAGIGAAYRIGISTGRKNGSNGNGNGNHKIDLTQFTTKELCLLRHENIDKKLTEISGHVEALPEIKAWIDLQKGK